ncbi:efflux RND transporter permease subunit [Aliarcobacter skirrowii]|uniref:Hydrophobe/amphiphile efflux-1 family RND transporter n=1 Tax=Aliarcobacter skirrowii CCUG 10374 TaxID=1032239 RepID=A0AAD0WP95_9BACT|nr:efflux RND transporter permease subunit [Aliarcobacter skirrowii]AXX85754.1 RND family efflux system, inner membrane transporter, AcrB family [Aliarcobacter skirrowii CCUG 10374]KAB0622004.1 efflux RND transporter permease subunit [Aliarcobacter skirrowii CCUG 10374]RXI27254.1 hydrophobe/amphiphile efflux-1 family RND transporter [Aliarcobacter skirrowii CCUG 10374]SUU95710.1 Acriflavine resistance protein B [Aliarcobacter skirrowii]
MIAKFFIFRPIFAWVISLIIMISGVVSLYLLPVEQYPDIAPPQINIFATYTGASAQTVENSVTQIIEQQLTGLDGMLYFSSSSSSSGRSRISIVFNQGVNPDIAQVQVQNKVEQILSKLPDDVQRQGVRVYKSQTDFLMLASVYDSTGKANRTDISDFLVSNLQDSIARIEGVGEVTVYGGQYAMRIWLDPYKLEKYNLIPLDIQNAINAQNSQASAGRLGAMPTLDNQQLSVTVTARSMFENVDEFENIILKTSLDGSSVKIKDVARVEIGAQSYNNVTALNGYPASGISIQLASGANAVSTSKKVKEFLQNAQTFFPEGYKVAYPRDTTLFIQASINEVVKTLIEAIILVVFVMFLFLKNFRATLIPAIAVPVVILGTFAILNILGFTINTLTMFALVLAIGLLVDDAIVVVENVERNMKELGLSAKEATIISMQEVTSALIGITTVLSVVFLPMAFFGGSTGVIYQQFSVTIISSMVLSVIVALTLTPALCATILKPHSEKSSGFIFKFNQYFETFTKKYTSWIEKIIKLPKRWAIFYLIIVVVASYIFIKLPTSFLPKEDQGSLMVQYTLPVGAVASRTVDVANIIRDYFLNEEKEALNTIFTISGFSSRSSGQNVGTAFISLKSWDERNSKELHVDSISKRAMMAFNNPNSKYFIRDARVFTINPSVIQGLGSSDGFEFQLLASSNISREELRDVKDAILQEAKTNSNINSVRADGTEESPQLKISYDVQKALSLGLNLRDIDTTLSAAWGGIYVNDYIDRNRIKRVYIQGDAPFRSAPEDLYKWKVRNSAGTMTPFSEFSKFSWEYGPEELTRFNGFMSYEIQGSAATGISSGVAMSEMEKIANKNANGTMYAYSGSSYQEKIASNQSLLLYAISLLVVFLCLAALYESWSVPFSVLLVVPLGVLGVVLAVYFRDLSNDVYFQVALLAVMGLASKNAILIVEFINSAYKNGMNLVEASILGAKLRLRPIIMTSLAFIAGIIPLAISSGAGANSRIAIGTAILGGTLSATILAIFFVPLFYIFIKSIFKKEAKDV